MVRQHDCRAAGQVGIFLTIPFRAHRIHIRALGSGCRVHPHVETHEMGFHGIIGDALFAHGCLPRFDELGVHFSVRRLEIIPGGQMTHEVGGIQTGKFFLTHREGDNRNIIGRNASRS